MQSFVVVMRTSSRMRIKLAVTLVNVAEAYSYLTVFDQRRQAHYPKMGPINFGKSIETSILNGKSVLITGGASGLGALIATAFAEYGARVTIADLNESQGRDLAATNENLNFVRTDVADWSSQTEAFKAAIAFSGDSRIDVVIAGAGIPGGLFISPEEVSVYKDLILTPQPNIERSDVS